MTKTEPRAQTHRVPDYVAFARQATRGQFVAEFPYPFLVSTSELVAPRAEPRTIGLLDDDQEKAIRTMLMDPKARRVVGSKRLTALIIRKVTDTSPDMITIGRTADNDIVIDHAQISKFHAFFREKGGAFELADAGSRNGTWVSGRLLTPKGPPCKIPASGESIRLAQIEFTFLSSAACWDTLRVTAR